MKLLESDAGFIEDFQREFVRITLLIHNAGDAGIDDHLGAYAAGLMRAVERSAVNRYAELCRLNDGVLLSMDGIAKLGTRAGLDAQLTAHALTAFLAGFEACRRAVIAGGHDALILHDDAADAPAGYKAACPCSDDMRHLHEPLIPFIHIEITACSRYIYYVSIIIADGLHKVKSAN